MGTEKTKRNVQISTKILNGAYIAEVAREYKLSAPRVRQILNNFCKKANKRVFLENSGTTYHGYYAPPRLKHLTENKDAFLEEKIMLERDIEKALVKKVKSLGGMAEKFTSPAKRSVPDRLVSLPGGRIIFVELKAPGKVPTENQKRDHEKRRALGCDVRIIDTLGEIDAFPKDIS